MIYMVLGMHKSGTTLVAQLLLGSGINMGFDLAQGEDSYDKEKCEGKLLRTINKILLQSEGKHSLEINMDNPLCESDEANQQVQNLLIEQSAFADWGMKDPRLTLTYEFWEKRIPAHKVIVVFRNPISVVSHYFREKYQVKKNAKTLKKFFYIVSVWKKYNQNLLNLIDRKDNVFVVDYDQLMAGGEVIANLEKYLGKKIVDVRNKNIAREQPDIHNTKFLSLGIRLTGAAKLHRKLLAHAGVKLK